MSEPSLEEKLMFIFMKSARDAGFEKWENKDSIPMKEFQEVFEKFSNNLLGNLGRFIETK
jgi:roadblock/LC7 domain-containing protein